MPARTTFGPFPIAAKEGDLPLRHRPLRDKHKPLYVDPANAARPDGEFAVTPEANKRARIAQQEDPLPFIVDDIFTYQAFATIDAAITSFIKRPLKHLPRLCNGAGQQLVGMGKQGRWRKVTFMAFNRPGAVAIVMRIREIQFEAELKVRVQRDAVAREHAGDVEVPDDFFDDAEEPEVQIIPASGPCP